MSEKDAPPPSRFHARMRKNNMVVAYRRFIEESSLRVDQVIMSSECALVYFGKKLEMEKLHLYVQKNSFMFLQEIHGRKAQHASFNEMYIEWDQYINVYLLREGKTRKNCVTTREVCYYDYVKSLREWKKDKTPAGKMIAKNITERLAENLETMKSGQQE